MKTAMRNAPCRRPAGLVTLLVWIAGLFVSASVWSGDFIDLTAPPPPAQAAVARMTPEDCYPWHSKARNDNCRHHFDVAEQFAPYALMAADTYRDFNRKEWLKARRQARGLSDLPTDPTAAPEGFDALQTEDWRQDVGARFGDRAFKDKKVSSIDFHTDCDPANDDRVAIPLLIPGWERLYDFDRIPRALGYHFFVPDLLIEVWARDYRMAKAAGETDPHTEYAIVFRGTQGSGGWWSNLRFLTALLPLFHDQYSQAARTYPRLLDQILIREEELRERDAARPGAPRITLVGHSLGAGLALYTAFRNPGVNKVIGFNPTPVSGFFATDYERRNRNLAGLQAVHLIFEDADVLHYLNECRNGEPIAPGVTAQVHCHQINLSGNNIFRQHEIGPMACRLAALRYTALSFKALSSLPYNGPPPTRAP